MLHFSSAIIPSRGGSDKSSNLFKTGVLTAVFTALMIPVFAQNVPITGKRPTATPGTMIIPKSSRINAEDRGLRAHTNVRLMIPATTTPFEAPPFSGYGYETPASLACIYRLVAPIRSCNPNSTVNTPEGGSETIAIVDAYDDPYAAADLASFSDQFGIPHTPGTFKVVFAGGTRPPVDDTGGWEIEEATDIEYAHAMAPKAMLYLVEANSNSFLDLLTAVQVAGNLVRCGKSSGCSASAKGKGEISMSWGGQESPDETSLDAYFTAPNVVYLAATGDTPGASYPSTSPNVIAVGGTTTARGVQSSNLIQEIAWSDAGGGLSYFELMPSYQSGIASIAQGSRATPDISADANPITAVWVYDNFPYEGTQGNWWVVGGTSVSTPTVAGILNAAGKFAASTQAELTEMYSDYANRTTYDLDFWDITYGACNYSSGSFSHRGYDLCTGLGSPKGLLGK
jgi:kumamolisin